MKLAPDRTIISLANLMVPMSTACKLIGMKDVDYAAAGNAKIECPFGSVFHPDGQKSFRIYDDKTAYCYACGEKYTPVSIYSQARDLDIDDAAQQLLDAVGYVPPTADNRFEAAVSTPYIVDRSSLAEALKTYCARVAPNWDDLQFDDRIAHKLRQCLDLLPNVTTRDATVEWLVATKQAMTKVLGDIA